MTNSSEESQMVLYRFRHLLGPHREWTKDILTQSVLYFSSPSEFNDPFDCKVYYRNRLSVEHLKEYYFSLLRQKFPHLNREQCKTKVAQDTKRITPEEFIAKVTEGMQTSANELGILSLSATSTNILLWSHYAASHTGICLKFLAESTTPFFGLAQQVNYKEDYPEVDLLAHSPDDQVQSFLLTKAIDWAYEEEWRIIGHNKGSGPKFFPEEFLLEVIFGARMKQEDKEEVLSWLSKRNKPVQVSQASLSPGSFSLKIEPYRP
ncbi:DUF2971 domain-containing protein [Geomobilimonas luticola]|uniref:DUF2971 domain-containing protein n=1 Tax=Geomobilimonas luticola TaxID=1114878 RepID=A0ABS5SG24_9BACT|nr:DUF2971 domain-containing protein [Geomobilimonas luticola]MBT0654323.1 DUF2971 domain-containing protein [Geomobilimonas luticola]